jgi:hypothetical protein
MSEFVERLNDASREGGRSLGLDEASRIINSIRFGTPPEVFDALTEAYEKIDTASKERWQRSQVMFASLREPARVPEEAVRV